MGDEGCAAVFKNAQNISNIEKLSLLSKKTYCE